MRRPALLALGFLILFAATATKAQTPNTIVTVAGGGTNSGAANTWTLTQPPDAVRDAAGNTYISDPILCVVYKVDTTGALSIYAGNGIFGVGGDGGPATSAGLTLPEGLALDANGNLFIADYLNNRIRRVDVNTHVITTVAGSEDPFVGGYAGDGGLATLARMNLPFAVAVDKNGNLFISDSGNNVVRRVDAQTQIITTYAGNGSPGTPGTANGDGGAATAAQLNLPVGLVTDGNGNLYIADSQDSVIRLVNAQTQIITTYAGSPAAQGTFGGDSGPATSAGLNAPSDIFLDGNGNLYIADTKNQRIRFVDNTTNHTITTIVGNGSLCMNPASACGDGAAATAAMLNHPTSVFLDSSGKLLIADQGDQRIRVVSAGTISNFAGGGPGGDGGAATSAILGLPNSLVVDSTGNLFVVEQLGERVRRLDATTHNISTYAGTGARGERMSSNGDGGQAANANFVAGFGIAIDGTGNIYVVDEKAAVVRKIDATTKIITTVAGNGLRCGEPGNPVALPTCGDGGAATSASLFIPVAIALDAAGNLYISDVALNTIRIVNPSGTIQTFAGTPGPGCTTYATNHCGDGGPATQALLNGPFGVAVGPSVQFAGATDVFVADSGNNVIRKIDGESGTISTYAFNGFPGFSGDGSPAIFASMTGAQQVALDDKENLYIAGGIDNVVRRVDQFDQTIITVAGDIENLGGGFSGDGGPSTKALIGNLGSALDKSHNLYIADGFQRVRKVNLLPVTTESGTFTAFPPTLNGVNLVDATTQEVLFSNTGLDDLILTVTSPVPPSAFQVGSNCMPTGTVPCTILVPPGGTGLLDVTFIPPAGGPTGPLAATLTVTTNDPANPSFNFPLSGTATNTSFALNVTIAPTGSGFVFSTPSGISCGIPPASVCSANFAQNSQVTLSATPNSGFTFMGWSGVTGCTGTGDCVVTMSQIQKVTATFATGGGGGTSAVTVSAIGNGSGMITSSPAGITCSYNGTATSGTCSFSFPSGTSVMLTGTATVPGSTLAGWLGFCSALGTNTCQTIAADLTTTAVFSVPPQAFTQGEVFAGAAGGMIFVYEPNGTLAQVLGSGNLGGNIGGIAFDTSGNLYAANPSATTGNIFGTVERFGSNGSGPTTFGTGPTGNGYDASPQSVVVGPDGNVYVAQSAGRGSLLKFAPAGGAASFEFFPPTDSGPINWIELLDDNDTILYTTGLFGTNGGKVVKAFDTGDNIYLPDFAQNLPGQAAFGLRELPDKTVLVADGDRVVRVNPSGAVTQTYTIGTGGLFHSLNLDPDGVTFWTLEDVSGTMYRINIATGATVTSFNTGVGLSLGAFNGFQGGLAVFGQPQSGGADVQVTMSATPNPVAQNSNVTYTITVMNNGVLNAANVAMTDAFPAGVTFVSAATSVGTCTGTTTVTCNLGTLANQAKATITIVVTATQAATLVNTVNVTSTTPDPITSNNTATTSTTVTGAVATHLSVTAPGTATLGTAFNMTVTALDATNAVVTSYAGTVHFTSSDTAAVLPANSTLTNGVGIFSVTLKTAGSQTITATDTVTGTITGTSGTITVAAAAPVTLQVKLAGTAYGTVTDNTNTINCTQIGTTNPSGTCSQQYPSGTQVTLTATTPGTFGGFVGAPTACTGTGNTCQFTITATETVTATFTPGPGTFPLTVQAGTPHTGGGTIASSPTGINCTLTGTTTSGTCMQNFPGGTIVTMMSAASPGSAFFGWTGTTPSCLSSSAISCVVAITAAQTVQAEFTNTGGTVNVTVTGAGNVKDMTNPTAINCTNTAGGTQMGACTSGYALGAGVTLVETPGAGATFSGWTGSSCANPTATTCSFQVTSATPIAVGATFTAGSGAATHFSVTAPAAATAGTAFNFTVTALTATNATATGYAGTVRFTSSDDGAVLPANSTLTNGVGTFSATLNTMGNQTITATDTVTATITGVSGTINVSTAATVQLIVQTAGTGTGTVTGNGINCTSGSANGCMASLPAGTQVVLTQGVTNGSTFGGWNGAPTMCTVGGATCTFTMPAAAETVTATFTAAAATLKSIAVTPANPTEPISSSLQFTATGSFSDGSMKDITSTVAWASSNSEAATISASGLATTGNTAGLTTTISASLNEVTGTTLLTVSSSPITISVTPPAGGTFPPVPPGGRLAIGIVLTSTPGFTGTVSFSCTTSSPTITCAPDPAKVTLTPGGPTDVAIVLNTFCTGSTTALVGPAPRGFGGGLALLLLVLTLGGSAWMWRRSPRWAVSFAILVMMAIGGGSCASPPKGTNGATQPGNYTVTFSATVNGVTTSTAPIPFTVE